MQSIVRTIALNCDTSINVGWATSRRNVVTTPRPQNENGGPGSVDDGFAGIFAFSVPAPGLNANSSERGNNNRSVTPSFVRRFMVHFPECVTQTFALCAVVAPVSSRVI